MTANATPCSPAESANFSPYSGPPHAILAIDVGNTNTVLGLYRLATASGPATLLADWRIATHRDMTADEFGILFHNLFTVRSIDMAAVTALAISSVVPPLDFHPSPRRGPLFPRQAALRRARQPAPACLS